MSEVSQAREERPTEATPQKDDVVGEIGTAAWHTIVYGLGNVLAKAVGFLMLPLYTRFLTPTDYGILEILDLAMSWFGMFLTMGLISAILRCYAAADDSKNKNKVISTALYFISATAIVVLPIGLLLLRPVSRALLGPNIPTVYLLLSFVSFLVGYVLILPLTYLRALEKSGAFTAVSNGALVLMLALNILFVIVMRIGVIGVLLSSLISASVQLLLLLPWTIRKVGLGYSSAWMTRMLKFGLPLVFSNLSIFVLNFSDRFFLKHFQSLQVVGLYAVGYKFAYMLNYLVIQPFYVMWQARMFVVHTRPDHATILQRIFVLFSFIVVLAGLALSVFSPEIIRIMVGPSFRGSEAIIPVVVLAYVFWGLGFFLQTGMFLGNRTSLVGAAGAISAVGNLLLNYELISKYGMYGAAVATALSFLTLAFVSYAFSQHVFPLPLPVGRVSLMLVIATALFVVSHVFARLPLPIDLIGKFAILAVFPVLLWLIRAFHPSESEIIVNFVRRTLKLGSTFARRFLPAGS